MVMVTDKNYNPIVTLSVLKLYILTLPLMPYFCLMSPSAVFMSLTPLVFGNIAQDFLLSLLTRKTPYSLVGRERSLLTSVSWIYDWIISITIVLTRCSFLESRPLYIRSANSFIFLSVSTVPWEDIIFPLTSKREKNNHFFSSALQCLASIALILSSMDT